MVVVSGGWSAEAAAAADAIATPSSAEWLGALGAREHVTMTADGHGASRQTWCQCPERPELSVGFEGWTAQGPRGSRVRVRVVPEADSGRLTGTGGPRWVGGSPRAGICRSRLAHRIS